MIWQDIILVLAAIAFFMRVTYRMGYRDGRADEQREQNQSDIEKSGDFFWCHGRRVQYPERPRVNSNHI